MLLPNEYNTNLTHRLFRLWCTEYKSHWCKELRINSRCTTDFYRCHISSVLAFNASNEMDAYGFCVRIIVSLSIASCFMSWCESFYDENFPLRYRLTAKFKWHSGTFWFNAPETFRHLSEFCKFFERTHKFRESQSTFLFGTFFSASQWTNANILCWDKMQTTPFWLKI